MTRERGYRTRERGYRTREEELYAIRERAKATPEATPHAAPEPAAEREDRGWRDLIALLGLAFVAGVYFVARPAGRWSEADSGLMALALRAVADTGELAPNLGVVYGNGFGYQVVSAVILAFTGISVPALQQVVYPIISTVLVLPLWGLYRELTGSARVASIATLILLLVPEHLFAILRGSHERIDRALMLTTLWLLVRGMRFRGDRDRSRAHDLLFLLTAYGVVATNALFGMSFVAALVAAWVGSAIAIRIVPSVRRYAGDAMRLLGWSSIASSVIVLAFVQFLYPPLGPSLGELGTIPARLFSIIFSGGLSVDSYAGVLGGWVSPLVYLLLSSADFILLLASGIVWLRFGWSWLRGASPASFGIWMLWLLYASITAQEVLSLVSDRTGALQGNLAYRAFALFATMAAPMLAVGVSRWQPRPLVRGIATAAIAVVAMFSLVKSTLDPIVSNKWMFYTEAELQGLVWADAHEIGTHVWIGPDDRLSAMYAMLVGSPTVSYEWDIEEVLPDTQTFLVSDVVRLQNARLGKTTPELGSRNLVYDNGMAQVYRVRSSP